jgi:hypothetical protein
MPTSKPLDGVDAELQERTRMLLAAVPGSWVASAFRTRAQQQALYDNYLRGGTLAAVPGTSMHEKGLAVDVDHANYSALNKAAKQCGLVQPVRGEAWHQQLDPKRKPLDSSVIPTITVTDHGDIDAMNLRTITFNNVQLDKDGCGWVPCDAAVDRILDITQQGSFPPADGYWKTKVQFGKQARTIPGSNARSVIEIVGGKKREIITFFVQVAA